MAQKILKPARQKKLKRLLKISASSVSRVEKCPASASLELKLKDKHRYFAFKDAAEYGTLVHKAGEELVNFGQPYSIPWQHPRFEDIFYSAGFYRDTINALTHTFKAGGVAEDKFRATINGVDCVAKCDYRIVHAKGVVVCDLKTGRFDYSESAHKQCFFAALLWLHENPIKGVTFYEIETVTIQPMYYDENRRVVRDKSVLTMEQIKSLLHTYTERVKQGAKVFHVAEHCKFCPSILICPEVQNKIREVFEMAKKATKEDINFKDLLVMQPAIDAWFESCAQYMTREMEAGKVIPGVQLSDANGQRRWIDPALVTEKLAYLKDRIYEPRKLKTPAQVEKITGKHEIEGLYETPKIKKLALVENPFEGV